MRASLHLLYVAALSLSAKFQWYSLFQHSLIRTAKRRRSQGRLLSKTNYPWWIPWCECGS